MTGPDLIHGLEGRLVNAWPALETTLADGWLLRFAGGYSKRANSASPMVPGAILDRALIDHIVHEFARRGLRPVFRLTGLEAPACEGLLEARGLTALEPSLCLTAPLGDAARHPLPAGLLIEAAASRPWIAAAAESYGGDKADQTKLSAIVTRIAQPAAFATLSEDGAPVAWGFAVAERGFVGLYDIVVAPNARGRGAGRRLCTGLMGWGLTAGAERAYLQVREDNDVAVALYRSLGFAPAYRYTHRVGDAPNAASAPARP